MLGGDDCLDQDVQSGTRIAADLVGSLQILVGSIKMRAGGCEIAGQHSLHHARAPDNVLAHADKREMNIHNRL
jgi:hypothetical protein